MRTEASSEKAVVPARHVQRIGRVVPGAIAADWLREAGVEIAGYVVAVGGESATFPKEIGLSALRESRDAKEVGIALDHAQSAATDRAGRTQNGDDLQEVLIL